jgi:hypothetical protein
LTVKGKHQRLPSGKSPRTFAGKSIQNLDDLNERKCCEGCCGSCKMWNGEARSCGHPIHTFVPTFYTVRPRNVAAAPVCYPQAAGGSAHIEPAALDLNARTFQPQVLGTIDVLNNDYGWVVEEDVPGVLRHYSSADCTGPSTLVDGTVRTTFLFNATGRLQSLTISVFAGNFTVHAFHCNTTFPILPASQRRPPRCCLMKNLLANGGEAFVSACGNECGEGAGAECPEDGSGCPIEMQLIVRFGSGGPFITICLDREGDLPRWFERFPVQYNASIRCEQIDGVGYWMIRFQNGLFINSCRARFQSTVSSGSAACPPVSAQQYFLAEQSGNCPEPNHAALIVVAASCQGSPPSNEVLEAAALDRLMNPPKIIIARGDPGCGCASGDYRDGPVLGANPMLSTVKRRGGHGC